MKPAWDALGTEYADSSSVIIGDADCTQHQDLCSKHGIQGYPTIKYFKQGEEPESYNGGRDLESLKKFVADNLEVGCQVDDPSGCDDKETAYIEKMKAKDASELSAQLKRLQGMKGKSMKPALKKWLHQRINILSQLADADEEL
mmetsp:Transcript_6165/g.16944  ORF Transcript_6165/g.16944 Transcript_6165/m.16944 type:complete len:144 (-) Transcript_6165:430-861(-)